MEASIVIPTYNRPEALKKCLQALQQQTFEKEWEVVVVDDGGKSDLTNVIGNFKKRLNIALVRQENRGPGAARNYGARIAKGKSLAFLDDDCEPRADWLCTLSKYAGNGALIGGKTENKLTKNMYAEASQLLVAFLYEHFQDTPWHFFTSNNFLLEKESFLTIGGFDESFITSAGEDREFCVRWNHFGKKLKYVPEAIIDHAHPLTFSSFWKQHFKYGKAAFQFQKRTQLLGGKAQPFRLIFYFKLLAYPLLTNRYNLVKKMILMALIGLSQCATFLGYAIAKFQNTNSILKANR